MRQDSDPMAAKAVSNRHHDGSSEHARPHEVKKPHKEINRENKREQTKEDEHPENLRPRAILNLNGNEVARVGKSVPDPSLLCQILPKDKNNLELEQGTALGSIPGSASSTHSTSTIQETNKDSGHKAGGLTRKITVSKTKNVQLPDRSSSKLRTQPPFVTKVVEQMKRSGSDLKQKAKSRELPSKEAVNKKNADSETRLKTPSRKKSTERGATLKKEDYGKQRNRSPKKVAGKVGGSGKIKHKTKTSDNKNK